VGKATIVLFVTEVITDVVLGVVHEVRHASRSAPPLELPAKKIGDITRAEMIRVAEEVDTRSRENKILLELITAGSWPGAPTDRKNKPGKSIRDRLVDAGVTPAGDEPAQVRSAFWSGSPQMTYQELFIVEAMKNENRVSSLTEEKLGLPRAGGGACAAQGAAEHRRRDAWQVHHRPGGPRIVRFVEWMMMAEALGRDWADSQKKRLDHNQTRRRNLDFLDAHLKLGNNKREETARHRPAVGPIRRNGLLRYGQRSSERWCRPQTYALQGVPAQSRLAHRQ
jgi:hypothetical protein